MFSPCRSLVLVVTIVLSSWAGRAATVNIVATGDTALFQDSTNNNLGGELSLPAGGSSVTNISRALIRFDLGNSIPTNAIITDVQLSLFVTNVPAKTNPVNSTFALYRMFRDWGEGNKIATNVGKNGAPATTGEATWDARFYPDTLWSVRGAAAPVDYNSSASATNFIAGLGPYTFGSTASLIADVQTWLNNPATNYGWLLRSLSESVAYTTKRFASREDPLHPPTLTVTFTVPGSSSFKIDRIQRAPASFQFAFTAAAGGAYGVEYRDGLGSGTWQVLTNIPPQSNSAALVISDVIGNRAMRFYRLSMVAQPTQITQPRFVPEHYDLFFAGIAGRSYTVEYRDSLSSGSWLTLTNTGALANDGQVVVSDLSGARPQRFYRVLSSGP
jgi:hypothetical protein